jgi:ribosomal-protein-serine acetyltransferase
MSRDRPGAGLPLVIEGRDVTLRALTQRDAPELFRLVDSNRRHLRRWLDWVDGTTSVDSSRLFIRQSQRGRRQRVTFNYGVFRAGRLIGTIGIFKVSLAHRHGEIGYWLAKRETGRGYGTQAVVALVGAAYRHLRLDRIEIRCEPENTPSGAIPRRLGFAYEGTMRHQVHARGRARDHAIYSLLRKEYRPKRPPWSEYSAGRR